MNRNISQEKKALENKKVPSNIKMRTKFEELAYSYLPESIRNQFNRNCRVRLARYHVYYPDLLLPEAKIVIEIDEGYHQTEKARKHDMKRDSEFVEHGYAMIRIKNEMTVCKNLFLNKLYQELQKITDLKERKNGSKFAKLIEDCLLIDESEVLDAGLSII